MVEDFHEVAIFNFYKHFDKSTKSGSALIYLSMVPSTFQKQVLYLGSKEMHVCSSGLICFLPRNRNSSGCQLEIELTVTHRRIYHVSTNIPSICLLG
jgi:hypothetical protein